MKTTNRFSSLFLSVVLAVISLLPFDIQAQTAAVTTTSSTNATGDRLDKLLKSLNNFSRLDEIVQLTKAGVGDSVILTYIQNSATAYDLNAQDIIKLRDQGVSSEVTTAMIQRGTEMRQATQQAANASQSTAVAAATINQSPPPVETTAPAPVTFETSPIQPESTVSVTYIGYPGYWSGPVGYYPRYVTFGSSYWYAPRVAFGVVGGGRQFGRYPSHARYCR